MPPSAGITTERVTRQPSRQQHPRAQRLDWPDGGHTTSLRDYTDPAHVLFCRLRVTDDNLS